LASVLFVPLTSATTAPGKLVNLVVTQTVCQRKSLVSHLASFRSYALRTRTSRKNEDHCRRC